MPRVDFSIPSHAEAVRWACLAVRGILEGIRIADDDRYYVELAVSEAITNVLRHAYGGRPGHVIDVGVAVEADHLVVEVSDTGVPIDPARIEEADLPPGGEIPADAGGRGLYLIRQAMDQVRVRRANGRNVLAMTKRHGGVR